MLEILTIVKKLNEASDFDDEVNDAIAVGYRLRKRNVIVPQTQPVNGSAEVMFYAELEQGREYKTDDVYNGHTVLK